MNRKPDQLDMALRREAITIRRQITEARRRIREWESHAPALGSSCEV